MRYHVIKGKVDGTFRYLGCVKKFNIIYVHDALELIWKKSNNRGEFFIVTFDKKGNWLVYYYENGVSKADCQLITNFDVEKILKAVEIARKFEKEGDNE